MILCACVGNKVDEEIMAPHSIEDEICSSSIDDDIIQFQNSYFIATSISLFECI